MESNLKTISHQSSRSICTVSEGSEEILNKVQDLQTKLISRETAIQSLEKTVSQHVKAMYTMQAEMQCMMETQRIKEKNAILNFHRKEKVLDKQVTSLQDSIKKICKTIARQKKKLDCYKLYVTELTHELEKFLKIFQNAEKDGIVIKDYHIQHSIKRKKIKELNQSS